jgi:hypothetical protein
MSDAASEQSGNDQFIFEKNFHDTTADLKPDMTEIDPPIIAEIQHLLDIAHDTNAVGTLDPHQAMAPQDVIKAQLPQPRANFILPNRRQMRGRRDLRRSVRDYGKQVGTSCRQQSRSADKSCRDGEWALLQASA